MEAISQAGAVIGVLSKDGIALAAEKKISSKVCLQILFGVTDRPTDHPRSARLFVLTARNWHIQR
jgi:hypothetical protein